VMAPSRYPVRLGDAVPINKVVSADFRDYRVELHPVILDHQRAVEGSYTEHEVWRQGLNGAHYLAEAMAKPMAAQLSADILRTKMNVLAVQRPEFAAPGADVAVVTDEASGLSIRGLRIQDPERFVHQLSFDVLGGTLA
jgi:hypothetical protein